MTIWIHIQVLLLAICCTDIFEGSLVISPSPRAVVCNVGDELEVTCNTNGSFLTWNVVFIAGNKIVRTLSSTIRNPERVEINSTIYTFSRISDLGSTDLISRLIISSVSQNLNGTKIVCKEIGMSAMMENTTVYIIGNTSDYLNSPEVNVSSEIFGTNDVYIALDVQVDNSFVNISMNSSREIGIAVNMLSAHFTTHVTYNTPTNVSVTAHLCGIHNSTVIALNYAKCESPSISDGSGLNILGYRDLALEGTNITLICTSGFQFNDPIIARCASTGKWIPDPNEMIVKCLANCGHPKSPVGGYILPYVSTVEGARVIFACQNNTQAQIDNSSWYEVEYSALCSSNGKWEPSPTKLCNRTSDENYPHINIVTIIVTSSMVCLGLVAVSLVLSFIIGFVYGRCKNSRAEDNSESCDRSLRLATIRYPSVEAMYECPNSIARVKHWSYEPQLEDNVAYGPLQ